MENEQDAVAAILKSRPASAVPADFLARVNARIDLEPAGWLGLADFRLWTLRLAPAAAALALMAALWSAPSNTAPAAPAVSAAAPASSFSPSSSSDWQIDVSGDALLDAALSPRGGSDVR